MNNIAFTIVAKNYFASAKTLAESINSSNPDIKFYIVLADKISDEIISTTENSFTLVTLENLGIERIQEFAYKYDVTEFATAIKPFCFDYFFENMAAQNVLYIDPDIYVYGKFDKVFELLSTNDIVVTPHVLTSDNIPNDIELGLLFSGTYNLGFAGVANSINGRKFIKWWSERLSEYAFLDVKNSLYTDQKWINLAVTEFDKVYILRDFSYNVAWWNFYERGISEKNGIPYVTQNGEIKPVVFFHFSGYKAGREETISKSESFYSLENREAIKRIFACYEARLFENGYSVFSKLSYAFLTYDNGIMITRFQRRLYRTIISNHENSIRYQNPFIDSSGGFYELLKNNKLIVKSYSYSDVNSSRKNMNGFERKEKIIQTMLKILKKMIGIQRYEVLTRYLSNSLEAEKQIFLIEKSGR